MQGLSIRCSIIKVRRKLMFEYLMTFLGVFFGFYAILFLIQLFFKFMGEADNG